MALMAEFYLRCVNNYFNKLFSPNSILSNTVRVGGIREAHKKTGTGGKPGNHGKPGRHGWKKQHGVYVTNGTTLVHQYNLRFCPGLNVGLGKRGQLYAKVPGKVVVTCEKTNFNQDHAWVRKWYPNRSGIMYKKYFNVLPNPESKEFRLVNSI